MDWVLHEVRHEPGVRLPHQIARQSQTVLHPHCQDHWFRSCPHLAVQKNDPEVMERVACAELCWNSISGLVGRPKRLPVVLVEGQQIHSDDLPQLLEVVDAAAVGGRCGWVAGLHEPGMH